MVYSISQTRRLLKTHLCWSEETVEVLTLQELPLPHKTFQRLSPAFTQHLFQSVQPTHWKGGIVNGSTCTHWRSTSVISTAGSRSASSLAASNCSGATCNCSKPSQRMNGAGSKESISYHQLPRTLVQRLVAVRHQRSLLHCRNNVLNTLRHTVPHL